MTEKGARPLVIYHDHCTDGFAAAWVAWIRTNGEADFCPAQYGQSPPDVTGRDVYVLDFSWKRPVMEDMLRAARTVVVLDHHQTAQEELAGLDASPGKIIFDMSKAGCRLTWEYFYPYAPIPWLIRYVEDRDLWRFELPHSREVSAALSSYPSDFRIWERLCLNGRSALITDGAAIMRSREQQVERICKNAREVVIAGCKVLAANTCLHISEVAGRLAEGRPFGAAWFVRSDGRRQWSLRSREGGIDVSRVARQMGGGGHEHAAGFEEGEEGPEAPGEGPGEGLGEES